jgi:hypothetical protein
MATTSGTVGQTQVNVATLIDTAFRRAGKNPSTVSGELLDAARNSLYMFCCDLMNDGVNLFCVRKNILNIIAYTVKYGLATGTDDVLNALYRTLTELSGTPIAGVDYVGITLDTPAAVQNMSGVFTTGGTANLVVEYDAGSGWTPLIAFGEITIGDGADIASDLERTVLATSWRLRDASGNNVIPSSLRFRNIYNELNMSQLNRDDYANLPNKVVYGASYQRSLQYWYDKQISPSLYIWPMSNQTDDQLVIYQHGQIEDIGKLSNLLAVPTRWYEAFVWSLAVRCCVEIPPEELPPGRLEFCQAQAITYTTKAGRGESDGSSFRLTPRIGGYTR